MKPKQNQKKNQKKKIHKHVTLCETNPDPFIF
jgi:hypothetical protein